MSAEFERVDQGEPVTTYKPGNEKWTAVDVGDEVYITKGYPDLFNGKRIRRGMVTHKEIFKHGDMIQFVIEKTL
jgi:hypothetical protein